MEKFNPLKDKRRQNKLEDFEDSSDDYYINEAKKNILEIEKYFDDELASIETKSKRTESTKSSQLISNNDKISKSNKNFSLIKIKKPFKLTSENNNQVKAYSQKLHSKINSIEECIEYSNRFANPYILQELPKSLPSSQTINFQLPSNAMNIGSANSFNSGNIFPSQDKEKMPFKSKEYNYREGDWI